MKADNDTAKMGIHLIAKGEGQFTGKAYHGGLPGDGWDGMKPVVGTATRTGEGKATLKNDKGEVVGELADGVITIKGHRRPARSRKSSKSRRLLGEKPPSGAVVLCGAGRR